MNRNKTLVLASVALAMAFLAVGCDRLWNDQPSNQKVNSAIVWVPGAPEQVNQIMNGASSIGQCGIVRPHPDYLNTRVTMGGTRRMGKLHVHVVPQGNLVPANVNNWEYKRTFSPRVQQYIQQVAWRPEFTAANKLDVWIYIEFENGGDCLTWKGKFTWTVSIPIKSLTLPDYEVQFKGLHPGNVPGPNYSYWQFIFQGVGGGYDIQDGVWYPGWCAEQTHYMNQNQWYWAVLWPSTYTGIWPIRLRLGIGADKLAKPYGWDNVNWILNNRVYPSGVETFWDVQAAIWYVLGNGGFPADNEAQILANGAVAAGNGYLPNAVNSKMAVILEPVCERQLVFVEIDP